jgi:hypothetical protein
VKPTRVVCRDRPRSRRGVAVGQGRTPAEQCNFPALADENIVHRQSAVSGCSPPLRGGAFEDRAQSVESLMSDREGELGRKASLQGSVEVQKFGNGQPRLKRKSQIESPVDLRSSRRDGGSGVSRAAVGCSSRARFGGYPHARVSRPNPRFGSVVNESGRRRSVHKFYEAASLHVVLLRSRLLIHVRASIASAPSPSARRGCRLSRDANLGTLSKLSNSHGYCLEKEQLFDVSFYPDQSIDNRSQRIIKLITLRFGPE